MSRLGRLMRTEIRLEHIHQEYEFRKNALKAFSKQATETRKQEFGRIKTSLRPREYNDTLYELRGVRSSGTGNWLFSNKAYAEWLDVSQVQSRVLWLKGIPGSGKYLNACFGRNPIRSSQIGGSLQRSVSTHPGLTYVPISIRQDGPVLHCRRPLPVRAKFGVLCIPDVQR